MTTERVGLWRSVTVSNRTVLLVFGAFVLLSISMTVWLETMRTPWVIVQFLGVILAGVLMPPRVYRTMYCMFGLFLLITPIPLDIYPSRLVLSAIILLVTILATEILSLLLRTQRRLMTQLARMAELPEQNPEPMLRIGADGKLLYSNAAGRRYLAEQDLEDEESIPGQWRDVWMDVVTTNRACELEVRSDASNRTYLAKFVPASTGTVLVYLVDISQQKKAEDAAIAQERMVQSVLNTAPFLVLLKDRDGRIVLANRPFCEFHGLDPEHVVGKLDYELVQDGQLAEEYRAQDQRVLEQEETLLFPVALQTDAAGETRWIQHIKLPVALEPGPANYLMMVGTDLTSLVEAEAELHHRDHLMQALAQAVHELIAQEDFDLGVQAALRLTGEATNVNRVYIYKNDTDAPPERPDVIAAKRRWIWTRAQDESVAEVQEKTSEVPASPFGLWHDMLQEGKMVAGKVDDFPASIRDILLANQIGSLLMMPIEVGGQYWGMIGFDTPDRAYEWPSSTRSLLETLANNLGVVLTRRQMEQSLAAERNLLRTIIDNLPDFIFVKNRQSQYVLANRYLYEFYDCQREDEILGKTDYDFYDAERAKDSFDSEQELFRNENAILNRIEEVPSRGNRQTRWALTTKIPIRDEYGHVTGLVGIGRDISMLIETENQLRAAKDAAEEAARVKSAFMANMSHEIRTPMNGVIGMTNLLLDTPLSPEQYEYVNTIRTSSNDLLRILNDILDFSRIESGRLEMESALLSVRECIKDVLDLFGAVAAKKDLKLRHGVAPGTPEFVLGDVTRLRQILANLVGNAVKFTPQGEVVVSVDAKSVDDGLTRLHFAVRDTGVGIPSDRLDRLFQSFSQVDNSIARKYGGTGLGLAISKRLAEMMEGTMWVESTLGVGSTFHFEVVLPVAAGDELQAVVPEPELKVDGSLRILLAEDNSVNRKVAMHMLAKLGYQPEVALDGLHAVELTVQNQVERPFDVILMDVQMPEMDGYEATRRIRQQLAPEQQPYIIAMTAHAIAGYREECLAAGMDDYVSKPVNMAELVAALQRAGERAAVTRARENSVD